MSPLFTGMRPAEVLLAEDNEGDVLLIREGLRRCNLSIRLHRVADGEACMAFLRREGDYADAPVPDLILLDLNMPLMGGQEVLKEMLADPQFRAIPVVILTTADDPEDVLALYQMRCSTFVAKPLCFEQFQRAIQTIGEYWFSVATVPGDARH